MSSSSNKLDYLSSKYLDDPKKKKKEKKHKKKESRRGHNHSDDDDHDALGWNLPADRQNNDYESDVENDELDEGPVVVDAQELGDAAAAATAASSMELRVPPTATPNGNNNSTSHLDRGQQRQRHDSSESEQSAQQEARSHQKRYDSSSSVEHEGRAATRQRHDSSDDDDDKNISSKSNTRRRHDSSDDDDDDADNQIMVNRPASHRKRHDSSASDSSREPSRRRSKSRRHDSEDDDKDDKDIYTDARHTKNKTRPDSDDDDDSSRHSDSNKTRLSSGHKAGLQTSTEFAKQQAKTTRRNKQLAQATVDQHGMGETIHRDESGRKQSAVSVAEAQEQTRRLALQKQQQELELNMGTKQKEAVMRQQEEMSKLANAGFARHADDDELETLRKGAIREGDPMAAQAAKQSRKRSATSRADGGGASAKRLYTGPPPKPNRFGIRPGFRWDGHDRGNGFEDKLLARQYMKQHQAEQAHMWSTRDM